MSQKITSENLDEVVEYNKQIESEIQEKTLDFLRHHNEQQINSPALWAMDVLKKYKYPLIQIPIDDNYFSGAIYIIGEKKIPILNTNLPRCIMYFAAWHEIYHLYYDTYSFDKNHIISNDNFMDERKAELFASKMLIGNINNAFSNFDYSNNSESEFLKKIYSCMDIYQTSYKAILIYLYENACKNNNTELKEIIKNNFDRDTSQLAVEFKNFGLDTSLVEPSKVIDLGFLKERIYKTKTENRYASYHEDNENFLLELERNLKQFYE